MKIFIADISLTPTLIASRSIAESQFCLCVTDPDAVALVFSYIYGQYTATRTIRLGLSANRDI